MRWGVFVFAAALLGCAHSKSAECASDEEAAASSAATVSAPADALLQKFSPALRWSLRDKTAERLDALAQLSAPLTQTDRTKLEESGLRILNEDEGSLHVSGDAQALLHLATFPQVTRIQGSRPMRPQVEK